MHCGPASISLSKELAGRLASEIACAIIYHTKLILLTRFSLEHFHLKLWSMPPTKIEIQVLQLPYQFKLIHHNGAIFETGIIFLETNKSSKRTILPFL